MPWLWVNTKYSIHQVQYTDYSIHQVQHTPSTAYTEYSIHRVQHTPSTASTHDCVSSLHSHDYELTPECSFSFWRASLYDWPPSASSLSELKGKVTLSHSHVCKSTNWWIESQYPAHRPSTASKYSSNLTQSRRPKCITNLARLWLPRSHNHGIETCSITISECISKFTWSRPQSVSPNMLNYRLQGHLQTCLIMSWESRGSNGSIFGTGRFYRSAWHRPYHIKNRRFFNWTAQLSPPILIRQFRAWYASYATLHGASFGRLRFLISSKLSKQ